MCHEVRAPAHAPQLPLNGLRNASDTPHTRLRAATSSGSTERDDDFVTRLGDVAVSRAFLGSRVICGVAELFRDRARGVSTDAQSGFCARFASKRAAISE